MFKILNRKNTDDKFDSSKHEITTKKDVNENEYGTFDDGDKSIYV